MHCGVVVGCGGWGVGGCGVAWRDAVGGGGVSGVARRGVVWSDMA